MISTFYEMTTVTYHAELSQIIRWKQTEDKTLLIV